MSNESSAALLSTLAPTLMPEITAYLERHRAELSRMLATPGQGGMSLARHRAKVLDGLLVSLFQAACSALGRGDWAGVSLAAVGGYGRGLVGWESDVEVRLLTTGPSGRLHHLAEAFLAPLGDAGLSIGHRVLTVEEALSMARDDLPAATSLLDWRHLAGDASASRMLLDRAFAELFSLPELPELMRRLSEEMAERHARFASSRDLLEPDVKLGAGGLRDLDVALWAARARWRASEVADLVREGALAPNEAEALREAAELLWAVRNRLHQRAGRRDDRLTLKVQEQLAHALGYAATDAEALGPGEAFMADYHRHARMLSGLGARILSRATPNPSGEDASSRARSESVIELPPPSCGLPTKERER